MNYFFSMVLHIFLLIVIIFYVIIYEPIFLKKSVWLLLLTYLDYMQALYYLRFSQGVEQLINSHLFCCLLVFSFFRKLAYFIQLLASFNYLKYCLKMFEDLFILLPYHPIPCMFEFVFLQFMLLIRLVYAYDF